MNNENISVKMKVRWWSGFIFAMLFIPLGLLSVYLLGLRLWFGCCAFMLSVIGFVDNDVDVSERYKFLKKDVD